MKRLTFCVFVLLFTAFSPAYAQWQRNLLRGFKKPPVRSLATQRAINQALRKEVLATKTLTQSTVTLDPSETDIFYHWENPSASAFVFEEQYNGKTYIWGATASHYFLQSTLLQNIPVQLVAQGHPDGNDVALFLIPPQLQDQFKPLKLAAHSPKKGETLMSAGYFDKGFHVEKNRKVLKVFPARILTSLVVEDKLAREGACGGPVLNKQGNVVGMHVGSSNKQAGFIVPVEHIREILQAYHNNGKALRPFYFNGRKIGDININEYVQSIEVRKEGFRLEIFYSHPYRAILDYNHLEKFVDASKADEVVFIIDRMPFSSFDKDQRDHEFEITYNLRNFRITKKEIWYPLHNPRHRLA